MSISKQDNTCSRILTPFVLSLPYTKRNPNLRWLILDGRKLALSHGCGEIYSYRGIALAVQYFWDKGYRNLLVCVPEKMKCLELLPYRERYYLNRLQDHLQDLLFYTPSEAMEASFMDALARKMDALIVTQLGPDTWSEHRGRILQFTFMKDSFILPEDPRGRNGPSLNRLCRARNTRDISVQRLVQDLMLKWKHFSKILKEPLEPSLSEEPGSDLRSVIIDGSNVAMSHGLHRFYSCRGIYLAVQHFWTEGYRNITACVPNWRYNSRNTLYGPEYLDTLNQKGLVTLTPSLCYDDRLMLKEVKEKNGLIVTNDTFKDFGQEGRDVFNKCIPFKFDGNQFIAFPKESKNNIDYNKIMEAMVLTQSRLDQHEQALVHQQENLSRQREDLARQREDLVRHDQRLRQLDQAGATEQLPPAPTNPPPPLHFPAEPRLPPPQCYDGDQGGCRGFLTQCNLTFEFQPITFPSDRSRIAYVITLLSGKALAWATAVWPKQGPECFSFETFQEEMLQVFDQAAAGPDAAKLLMSLRQDKRSVADYAITFRTLAAESGWNEMALFSAFHHGLSDSLKCGLAFLGCPSELESLIAHSIRLENRMRERRWDQGYFHRPHEASPWSSQPCDDYI